MDVIQYYPIVILPQVHLDIEHVYNYIKNVVFSPIAANNYRDGIYTTIHKLRYLGVSIAVSQNEYLQQRFGSDVRTVNYKRMTVIYSIRNGVVVVRCVIASRLIR